jgi:hypothetical protein
LLDDGSAALMVRADVARNIVWLKDPAATMDEDGVAVDELRLSQVWSDNAILMRPERGAASSAAFCIRERPEIGTDENQDRVIHWQLDRQRGRHMVFIISGWEKATTIRV